jgi:glycosyltransferase involved in cell wall biosynthesis
MHFHYSAIHNGSYMNPFQPKVSIIIPVYNGSNFLASAIDSALGQTYQRIEVLVINDGSTDDGATRSIATSYGNRIRYFEKTNGGVSTALNHGIEQMTGDYFSWLSHDDLYEPQKVEHEIAALATLPHRERTIVYSDFAVLNVDTGSTRRISLKDTEPDKFRYRIAARNDVHGCSLLIPRTAFSECGVFDETLRASQDYDLWFRMSKSYTFVHIPEHLVIGRIHGQQVGVRMSARVASENSAFRRRAVDALTDDELQRATGRDAATAFVGLARFFASRRLYSVAGYCARLSFNKARAQGVLGIARWVGAAVGATIHAATIAVFYGVGSAVRGIARKHAS